MACLYKRSGSPYWWLKPKRGKPRSTRMRHAIAHETQKAQDILETELRKERQQFQEPERWEFWAPQYIAERYEESPKSLERYNLRWKSIRNFFRRHKIDYPRQLTFNSLTQYVAWRRAGDKEFGVWPGSKNTAIGDVKFLGLLMRRAIQLGFATTNPCEGLGLKKVKPEPKREVSDKDIKTIWTELANEPEWMRVCFQICLHTGCRLRESTVPLDCVDVQRRFIHFPHAKGDKPFTVPLRDELLPLFKRLQEERPGMAACDLPHMPSKEWWRFFKRLGMPYSIHCLRVTFISRLARAGVPASEAMRLVNHASLEIHRIYQRFQPEDLRASLQKLSLPALPTHDARENLDGP